MRLWIVTLALAASSLLLADENCEQLKKTILQVDGLPQKAVAGNETLPIKFELTDYAATLLKPYSQVYISVLFRNEILGSLGFSDNLFVKENNKAIQTKFERKFKVPKTAQGLYKIGWLFLNASGPTSNCYGDMNRLKAEGIEVPSHPAADIHPPIVLKSRFNSKSAKPNEEVVLSFSVEDKENSPICTKENKEQKLCSEYSTFHLQLSTEKGPTGEVADMHISAPILKIGASEYEIRFVVPKNATAGHYHLETLNIFDLAGNGSTQVSDLEKKTALEIVSQ